MTFCGLYINMLRIINLQCPTCYIKFVRSIVSRFSSSPVPAIPMPVVIPNVVHIFNTWCRSLKKFPIETFRNGCLFLNRTLAPGVRIECYRFKGGTNHSFMNLTYYINRFRGRTLLVTHLNHFPIFLLESYE